MFSAMHEKGYLRANAMANLGRTLGLLKPSIDVRRSLSERQWAFAMEVLHEKPDTPERRRLQLLLELGSTTGLRLSELATTRLKGFRRELVDGEEAWLLDVIGKGGKLRTVMVFDEIKTLLEQHHQDMDAAGLGFDARVARVQAPNSLPITAAGERMAGPLKDSTTASQRVRGRHCRTRCAASTRKPGVPSLGSSSALPLAVIWTGSACRSWTTSSHLRLTAMARWSARRSTRRCVASSATWPSPPQRVMAPPVRLTS
jgi:hypothetical protein